MSTLRDWVIAVAFGKNTGSARRLVSAVTGAVVSLVALPAAAQTETFTLDRAQISGAPDDGFMVHRPYLGEQTRVYVNSALGFSLNPLRDEHIGDNLEVEGSSPMTAQFPVYLSAGLQLEGIVGLALHVPFTPLQFPGQAPDEAGFGITDYYAAMNDVRFDGRIKVFESDSRKTRFGLLGTFTIATGRPVGFGGDREATAMLAASGEHDFGPFYLTGHVGPHFRPDRYLTNESQLAVGSELRYAVGAFLPLRDDRVRLGVEVWGSTGLVKLNDQSTFFRGRNTTVEWLGQIRFLVAKDKHTFFNAGGGTRLSNGYGSADVRALVSIGRWWGFKDIEPPSPPPRVHVVERAEFHDKDSDGDGYPDDIDECPDVKEDGKKPKPSDGCPAPQDADGDGIPDSKDKCPNDPEDLDGIQDKDGCPEEDADSDKVPDKVDKCPLEPGPPNKDASKNGCPTLTKVSADGKVSLLQPIQFDYGRASIKPVSFPILQEVVLLLNARPTMKLDIQGHTDSRGSRDYNVKLSRDRAASVMNYLVGQGIDKSRLTSEGYGPDKPIDSNDTDEGRAKNRRVDFVIKEGGPQGKDEAWE